MLEAQKITVLLNVTLKQLTTIFVFSGTLFGLVGLSALRERTRNPDPDSEDPYIIFYNFIQIFVFLLTMYSGTNMYTGTAVRA